MNHCATWRVHGRVDGAIPKSKLEEFERTAAKFSSAPVPCVGGDADNVCGTRTRKEVPVDGRRHTRLERGAWVRLQGLEAQAELNGSEGICLGPTADSSGRWVVSLDRDPPEELRRLKPENLKTFQNSTICVPSISRKRLRALEKENRELKKKQRSSVRDLERADVIRGIAKLESEPLQQNGLDAEEKKDMKRRLMLKWHPDKAPGPEHAAIATEVTQELQNQKGWHDER